jgi:hypothetical protein
VKIVVFLSRAMGKEDVANYGKFFTYVQIAINAGTLADKYRKPNGYPVCSTS